MIGKENAEVMTLVDIKVWLELFAEKLDDIFGTRVWFVGLQGSYGRGEATESSDIDVVVVLDVLTAEDLEAYRTMLDTLPHRDLICGFLSGKAELMNWEPSDIFQFYYDTKPIKGTLDELLQCIDDDAIGRAIRIGACNIYHGCVHNMLHERNEDILRALYKNASFVVQAICFRDTGVYTRSQEELVAIAQPDEQMIVNAYKHLKNGEPVDFQKQAEELFYWSQKWVQK